MLPRLLVVVTTFPPKPPEVPFVLPLEVPLPLPLLPVARGVEAEPEGEPVTAVVPVRTVCARVVVEPVALAALTSVCGETVSEGPAPLGGLESGLMGRTRAKVVPDGDDVSWVDGGFGCRAHDSGAIADAVAEVHVAAEALVVCCGAS